MTSVTRLDEFGILAVTGKDAATFLQGYTTCDVNEISASHSTLGAMCNLQGRMICNFRVAPMEDGLLLRMDRSLIEPTREFLKKYIVFSKAETRDDSDTWQCFGVIGDGWGTLPATVNELLAGEDHYIVRVSDAGPRFEVWTRAPLAAFDRMSEVTAEHWRRHEIADGLAWVTAATSDNFIPQMFNYDYLDGISFNKGCYLGQEIVARMHHRGQVKRRLFKGATPGEPRPGNDILSADGKSAGTVVAIADHDGGRQLLAVMKTGTVSDELQLADGDAVTLEPLLDEAESG